MFFIRLLLASAVTFCFTSFVLATVLVDDEIQALRDIAKTLGKTDWNFNEDPCSAQSVWVKNLDNAVNCNCSIPNTTGCHVVSIVLKAQNLPGTLPPELVNLPYLEEIDLTRNYLNGTIPPKWGSFTRLVNISFLGNRLTGSIPKELGNISTLKSLVLEFNMLSGSLPKELGNLINIERLHFTSNYFTGEIPETFAGLTTMKDFRIGENNFSGKIPDLIQNWTNLDKLVIQASGLNGPIPLHIAFLENLSDLRISDLRGPEAKFPPLQNMTKMKTLILRSCNITGQLPEYLGNMNKLTTLDLSFNKLTGGIPSSYVGLDINFMYLTGNLLSGPVPPWMLNRGSIDLSYNNFANGSLICEHQSLNLFTTSSKGSDIGNISCLRSSSCPKIVYSLQINCGGLEVTINGNTMYDDDTEPGGASKFLKRGNWAFSSTGNFMDDKESTDIYILGNSSKLTMANPELYMTARLSPLSLTYYAFCLGTGPYKINLHFVEIKFTNDNTYSSLGRRVFDIYIQGELVEKDFNIEDEAGGVGMEVIKHYLAVVNNNTLEIRFYWAGKGTTGIPERGVYGPLISAISVHPDFNPPSENGSSVSVREVVGIVAVGAFILVLVLGILWWKGCLGQKSRMGQDLKGLDLQTGLFTLRQIRAATNNFDVSNKVGEGGFGSVYKGLLSDGTTIAVKQLSSKSKQGNREFVNEIGMISALQHPHLVKLYGCCIEGNQLLLVYEYMENNSLARALFGSEECQLKLDWTTRHKICVGIARGLAYLHEESRLKIVHRDIKATNVLLDKYLNPKISDFGLAKLDEEDNTHISTRIAGTYGYMAPEYAMRGYLTDKADVYSFGVVTLEIVSGRSNTSHRPKEEPFNLLDWAHLLKEEGNLIKLVDPRLGSDYNKEEVMVVIHVALLCTNVSSAARPTMSSVVSMLEGNIIVPDLVSDMSLLHDEMKAKELQKYYQISEEINMSESKRRTISMDGPWTATSSSAADLYPINPDSGYLENRS
ncbi:probable leucine-rich repeat receptor-like serine/threonine-protein kinase At3g14840 isoform X2 [Quercus robur]|uniref:probable leucine-rich repeat receptor-like serine/threonine-protein kinase At3g14840 isoform X2 n=1 Tax=Quercus robur TaxID=38942 RepID=UPI002161FC37|nr:probable leucine-rich repeat receptor-like serine/threonine-protein kinase At3g14840 isoform X2 [Quercus robur]XP_050247550.1 probable leucine-rich repeat receptor-like serine/threonine-protein kinase At3g14840 isoform X2 [Quercus robur]